MSETEPPPPPPLSEDPPAAVRGEESIKQEVAESNANGEAKNELPHDIPPPPPLALDMASVLARLRELLPTVDLSTTSEKMIRKRLEDELKVELTSQKAAIRAEIQAYLDSNPVEDGEEEEGGEEEEEEAVAPKKKKSGAFNKDKLLSPALAALIGSERESRPQVVKKLWDYIKENNLQNPKDKRKIILDDKLKTIFPCAINMFSMNKYLGKHIMDDDECYDEDKADGGGEKPSKSKKSNKKKGKKNDGEEDEEDEEDEEEDDDNDEDYKGSSKRKRKSSGGGGSSGATNNNFTKPLKLSSALAALVGVQEMSRPHLTSWLNKYFKDLNLHDPSNKQRIICNDVLRELFNVDSFRAFGEPMKLLKPHLSKIE